MDGMSVPGVILVLLGVALALGLGMAFSRSRAVSVLWGAFTLYLGYILLYCLLPATNTPPYTPDGLVLFFSFLIAILLWPLWPRIQMPPSQHQTRYTTGTPVERCILVVFFLMLAGGLYWLHLQQVLDAWYAVVAWVIGLVLAWQPMIRGSLSSTNVTCGGVSFAIPFWKAETSPHTESRSDFTPMHTSTANSLMLVVFLVTIPLFLSSISSYPTDIHGDEGEVALQGMGLRDSGIIDPFLPVWFGIPSLFFQLPAYGMAMLGDTYTGLRISQVPFTLISIVLIYLIASRLFDRTTAIVITVAFIATPYAIHFTRRGIGYNQTWLFTLLTFYALIRGYQDRQHLPFFLAGTAASAGWLSYQANKILFPLALLSVLLLFLYRYREWKANIVNVLFLVAGFALTYIPLGLQYAQHPEMIIGRFARINDASPTTTATDWVTWWEPFRVSLLSPVSHPDNSPFLQNYLHGGMLGPILASCLLTALVLYLIRGTIRSWPMTLCIVWATSCIIAGSALTDRPPNYQRMVGSYPFLVLLAGTVPSLILQRTMQGFSGTTRTATLVAAACILLLANSNLYFNKIMSGKQRVYDSSELARTLQQYDHNYYMYFMGAPYYSMNYGNIRFLNPQLEGQPIQSIDVVTSDRLRRTGHIIIVLIKDHVRHIPLLLAHYPAASVTQYRNPEGELYFGIVEIFRPAP